MIFSGVVRVTTYEGGRDVEREYRGGQLITIPPHVPHIFRFVNDTVMAEWWDADFEARYYMPYRKRVDAALRRATEQANAKEGGPGARTTSTRTPSDHVSAPTGRRRGGML